ncbi:hypothetical protein EI94DRAFT_482522 [Lactarius quietus]|nr:hypothetical protein EI94DRAFT_482522 [Lactarius quietus]
MRVGFLNQFPKVENTASWSRAYIAMWTIVPLSCPSRLPTRCLLLRPSSPCNPQSKSTSSFSTTMGSGDSQCCGFPNRRARLTFPSQSASQSECLRRGTIGELSDDVLLSTFRYYLDAFPRFWPRLVHICRRWRRIVFASRRSPHFDCSVRTGRLS